MSLVCYVYTITAPSGNQYVGSTKNLANRWAQHRAELASGKHHNKPLLGAARKYGIDALVFEKFITVLGRDALLEYEQAAIDFLNPTYNSCRIAGSTKGRAVTEQHRRRLSESVAATARDAKIAARRRARYALAETRARMSEAAAKAWSDPAIKGKMRVAADLAWRNEERRKIQSENSKRVQRGKKKLTEVAVALIKSRYVPRCPVNGGAALGREFGVSQVMISRIIVGKAWF